MIDLLKDSPVPFENRLDAFDNPLTKKNKIIFRRWLKWMERLASSCNRHNFSSASIGSKIRKTNAMIEQVQKSGKGELYFISDCYRARSSLISSIKTSPFIDQIGLDLSLIFTSNTSGEKYTKNQVQCMRIIALLEHFQLEIDSDQHKKWLSFLSILFGHWFVESAHSILSSCHEICSLWIWLRWSTSQSHARCSFEVQTKEQERREVSEQCRPLSKLDELHTHNRYSMDRWTRLRFTPTDVHFMRPEGDR